MPKYRYHTCAECRHSAHNDTTEDVQRALTMERDSTPHPKNEYEVQEYTCISCKQVKPWWWFSTWPKSGTRPVSRSEGVKQFV